MIDNKFPLNVLLPKPPNTFSPTTDRYLEDLNRALDDAFKQIHRQFQITVEEVNSK
jgi:hypothetical protein